MPKVRKLSQDEKQQAQDEAVSQNELASEPSKADQTENLQRYPTINEWLSGGGWLEIGYDQQTNSLIRIIGKEDMLWQGKQSYPSIDAALEDAELNLKLLEQAGEL
jgi:hypothetical protein